MATNDDIRVLQERLIKILPRYASKQQIKDILRSRKTQLEDLRGQTESIDSGADEIEAVAEDLEQRITALEA